MPLYSYVCKNCNSTFDKMKRISERYWTDSCPSCGETGCVDIVITSPMIVSDVGDLYSKTDSAFRENLNRIKKHNKNSTINT